ncbi:MAG: hypothetical protein AAF587_33400 [Bacteroidota bacterium]
MFGLSDSLAFPTQNSHQPVELLEPHVELFDIHSKEKGPFIFPFQLITYCLIAMVALGFVAFLIMDDTSIVQVIFWIQLILAPFYLPGLYYYSRYFMQERFTQVELDFKSQLIKYSHSKTEINLLFQADQVESCVLYMSLLFPYKVNYLSLQLKDGPRVHISSLVVEPSLILHHFSLDYEVRKRLVNAIPTV